MVHLNCKGGLTLDIGNALLEDLLQNLGVLELLLDLADDRLSKLALLALLDLALVTDPGVKDLLSLSGKSSTLLEFVSLGLKLSGFLQSTSVSHPSNVLCLDSIQSIPWKQQRGTW